MSFRVEDLVVRYGTHTALHGISLDFRGGALGLLGPNGAGKSSLLRALLGFVSAASGRISVLDAPPDTDPRQLRRWIGYHPEDDVLLPGLNAVSAVALSAELSGLPRTAALRRAHEMLFFVGLGEVRYRSAETYSQGMRQRLKLAHAIVHDPRLLILDEPTNGLDPRGRQEILDLIADLAQRKGMSVVLTSHLLPDVERVCDQVVLLDAGRIVRSGTMDALLASSSRAFEVRLKGPQEAFRAALGAASGSSEETQRGRLLVRPPEGDLRAVFRAAIASGCQVRHLAPARQSLSEVFTHVVQQPRNPDADS